MGTTNLTKMVKLLLFAIALFTFLPLSAQVGIISICVNKEYADNPRTTLRLKVPLDPNKRFFKLDLANSEITMIKDDTGHDLLSNGQGVMKESSYGYISSDATFYDLQLEIDGAPQKGASGFDLMGSFLVSYVGDVSEEKVLELPFKDHIQSPLATELGEIRIINVGSATLDDGTEFLAYTLDTQIPIEELEVEGGDDSEEYRKMGLGLEANSMVFKEEPAHIKVKVKTSSIDHEKVPAELTVRVGF